MSVMKVPENTETTKTAQLKSKIAAMSFKDRADRAVEIALSGDFENNREEFVKLLFGPDAIEVDD